MSTEIRIDGQTIDLAEETSLPITLINPHLTYGSIPDSKVTIPNAPFSLANQRIFEYAEMPQAGNELRRYQAESLFNGALIYKGLAYVKSADPLAGYQLEVSDDLKRFFGAYQAIPMNELDLGTIDLPVLEPLIEVEGQLAACFPVIINPDYYGTNGAAVSYSDVVNDYEAGDYTGTSPKVPMLFISFLLSRIAALTGVTIEGPFLDHATWSKLILTNWRALDGALEITVNRHVPAWTIPQFLLELRKVPNLKLDFYPTDRRLVIDFWEPCLKAVPKWDWTDKAAPGHDKYPEINRRLHLAFDLDSGDGLMKDRPAGMEDYITPATAALGDVATGLAKINFGLSTFLLDDEHGLPYARQTGVTELFNQLAVSTAPRLLFWHGMNEDEIPSAYPEADGISLYLNGPTGIAATSWKQTEAMRLGMFYLKKDFILDETDLARFDFSDLVHYNGLNYLVASITGDLPVVKAFTALLLKV